MRSRMTSGRNRKDRGAGGLLAGSGQVESDDILIIVSIGKNGNGIDEDLTQTTTDTN